MKPIRVANNQRQGTLGSTNRFRRLGFSLLELMIVLVVLTGTLAIVWPNMNRSLQRTSLNEAAGALRSALDDARYQAMVSGQFWFIRLERDSDRVEYGRFSDFVDNQQTAMFAALAESSNPRSTAALSAAAGGMAASQPPRHCRLPSHIVVSEVTAGKDGRHLGANDDDFTRTGDSLGPVSLNNGELNQNRFSGGSRNWSSAGSSEDGVWCIPVLSQGLGQDTTIRLTDTKIDRSILIFVSATTGAIEVL